MRINFFIKTIFIVIAFLFLNSCAKKRVDTTGQLRKNSIKSIVDNHLKSFASEESRTMNSTLTMVDGNKKNTIGATFDFYKGEQIDLSASYFGFNVAKGSFDNDGFVFYEKIKKTYAESDYSVFNSDLFDFQSIEKLLSGKFFLNQEEIEPTEFKILENKDFFFAFDFKELFTIKSKDEQIRMKGGIAYFDANYKLKKINLISNEGDLLVGFNYTDWQVDENQIFPGTIEINSELSKILIEIKNKSIKNNAKELKKIEVPKGYEKMDYLNLLKFN